MRLDLDWQEVDLCWVHRLDFSDPYLGIRDERLQCRVATIDSLDWTLITFLAPVEKGLWLLRVYEAFETGLKGLFYAKKEGRIDESRLKKFEQLLSEYRISMKSEVAYHCFGLYPKMWGDKFVAPVRSAYVTNRLLSVAIPTQLFSRVKGHFQEQIEIFGPRCVTAAKESDLLFITGDMIASEDSSLLLKLGSSMGDVERSRAIERLSLLVENNEARERFVENLPPGLIVSGAFRAPDSRDILDGKEAECVELAKLRVRLMCVLNWPHAIQQMRSISRDMSDGRFSECIAELGDAIEKYPVISDNPLG